MKTILTFSNKSESPLPERFEDIRFSEEFVRSILEEFTKEGDLVFDPFAGYGTTLRIAEEMGRVGYGIEYDKEKVDFVQPTLKNPDHLFFGDALKISEYDLPQFNFSLTSPLYMQKGDENPFHTECTEQTDYDQYLKDMRSVYEQVRDKLKQGGQAIIEVSNVKRNGVVTTLAWDIARVVSEVLTFEGEIVLHWKEGYGYEYDHSYALVFRK